MLPDLSTGSPASSPSQGQLHFLSLGSQTLTPLCPPHIFPTPPATANPIRTILKVGPKSDTSHPIPWLGHCLSPGTLSGLNSCLSHPLVQTAARGMIGDRGQATSLLCPNRSSGSSLSSEEKPLPLPHPGSFLSSMGTLPSWLAPCWHSPPPGPLLSQEQALDLEQLCLYRFKLRCQLLSQDSLTLRPQIRRVLPVLPTVLSSISPPTLTTV